MPLAFVSDKFISNHASSSSVRRRRRHHAYRNLIVAVNTSSANRIIENNKLQAEDKWLSFTTSSHTNVSVALASL